MGDIKRTLWLSNASHVATGYGNQTKLFTPLIKRTEGLDLMIASFVGVELGWRKNGDGIVELGRCNEAWMNDIIEAHYQGQGCNAIVTLIDPFVLDVEVYKRMNWAGWIPIDCAPVSPENWKVAQHAKRLWSMSRFGHEELLKMGYPEAQLDYVPHGINTDVFKPVVQAEARERVAKLMGREDLAGKYIVMTNAANKGVPSRKNFIGMLRAFKAFAENKPEAMFYIHTDMDGRKWGEKLHEMVAEMGLTERVLYPSPYDYQAGFIDDKTMNDLYNMADVFFLLSYGEGFGIPIMEAQSAGLPVVVTKGTAMAELGKHGYLVQASPMPCTDGRVGCEWAYPSVDDAVFGLNRIYAYGKSESWREKNVATVREFAMEYDYRAVFDNYMLPALKKLHGVSDILPSNPHPLTPSPLHEEGEQNPSPVIEKAVQNA